MTASPPKSEDTSSSNRDKAQQDTSQDELFFDQLKDQFAFFYALTMVAIDGYKQARLARQQAADQDENDTSKTN